MKERNIRQFFVKRIFFFYGLYDRIEKNSGSCRDMGDKGRMGRCRLMENENAYLIELMRKYRDVSEQLLRYIPYFEGKQGQKNYNLYRGEDQNEHTVAIPVYEGTLLAFVKEVQKTGLVDRNYVYVLSRYGIRTHEDEVRVVNHAEFKDIEVIYAVMAKYVLGGMTKGLVWAQAVENGIFLLCLTKLKEVLNVWDAPLA